MGAEQCQRPQLGLRHHFLFPGKKSAKEQVVPPRALEALPGHPAQVLQAVGVCRVSLPACPCVLLMALVWFFRSCQAELSSRLAPEQVGAPDTPEQRGTGTGESRRPGERPGESPGQTPLPCLSVLAGSHTVGNG